MRNILVVIFLLFIVNIISPVDKILAPFISELQIESQDNRVLLQWQNPVDFKDYISIYRSNSIIDSNEKLSGSEKIALLTNNENKFVDTPGSFGTYYYAVIITEKASNNDNRVFVPYRNYSLKPVVIEKFSYIEIIKINSISNESNITINWDYKSDDNTDKKIILFRNTEPIENESILNNSIKITSIDINAKTFIDMPVENINYYYAIFIENEKNKNYIKDVNITLNPVSIVKRTALLSEFSIDSFIPLPLLTLKDDPVTGKVFLDPQILKNPVKFEYNNKVKKIINSYFTKFKDVYKYSLKQKNEKMVILEPHILNDEDIFETNEYSQEYKNLIINIKNKKYDNAVIISENLIKEILPDNLLIRVSYYLGQLYYYKKNTYMSFIYLNNAYEAYKKEVSPYLNSIYQNIFYSLER